MGQYNLTKGKDLKRLRTSQNGKIGSSNTAKSVGREAANRSNLKDNHDLRDLLVVDAQKLKQKNNATTLN